ncbi:MAG: NIL domain-containing protein [Fimbriimonadales bacterium]
MEKIIVNISGGKEQVGEAWIWRLSREFNIKVNIMKANIDQDYGWLQLELEGPLEEVQRATAWLHTTGLHVDPMQRSVGA